MCNQLGELRAKPHIQMSWDFEVFLIPPLLSARAYRAEIAEAHPRGRAAMDGELHRSGGLVQGAGLARRLRTRNDTPAAFAIGVGESGANGAKPSECRSRGSRATRTSSSNTSAIQQQEHAVYLQYGTVASRPSTQPSQPRASTKPAAKYKHRATRARYNM